MLSVVKLQIRYNLKNTKDLLKKKLILNVRNYISKFDSNSYFGIFVWIEKYIRFKNYYKYFIYNLFSCKAVYILRKLLSYSVNKYSFFKKSF